MWQEPSASTCTAAAQWRREGHLQVSLGRSARLPGPSPSRLRCSPAPLWEAGGRDLRWPHRAGRGPARGPTPSLRPSPDPSPGRPEPRRLVPPARPAGRAPAHRPRVSRGGAPGGRQADGRRDGASVVTCLPVTAATSRPSGSTRARQTEGETHRERESERQREREEGGEEDQGVGAGEPCRAQKVSNAWVKIGKLSDRLSTVILLLCHLYWKSLGTVVASSAT